MTSLKSNNFPEAPCHNTVTLGNRASTYEFDGTWNTHLQSIITCGNLWVVKFWMIFIFIFISFILSKFGGHSILKIHGPVMSLNTCLFPFSFLISVILESTYLSICLPFLKFFSHYELLEGRKFDEFSFISRL